VLMSVQKCSARQHIGLYAIARPSVCPSVGHTCGSVKTVEVSIMKFSPYGSPSPNFCNLQGKFHPEILMGSQQAGASNKGGAGKTSHFLALNVNISKTVEDTAKVILLIINRKSHMRVRLAPRSMTLDDLGLL